MADKLIANDVAWQKVLDSNPYILGEIRRNGITEIKASTIKKVREPRLMVKFDTIVHVPQPLRANGLDILPDRRGSYVLGRFSPYHRFPADDGSTPIPISLPDLETLRVDSLTSEANAINALAASGALEDFLGVDWLVSTFNGRMGSDDFSFEIASTDGGNYFQIDVHAAQLEIDAGFETDNAVIIMEAKNVAYDDFNVRQLYYPFRKYYSLVDKPIRLVFSQYTNLTYRLFEFEFPDPYRFSSIRFVRSRSYTFGDTPITWDDLRAAWSSTSVITDDNQEDTRIPFIQADRFDRVLSLVEKVNDEVEMPTSEIAEFVGFTPRQANYYPAAGEYLGLFDRSESAVVRLTPLARNILSLGYRNRQLSYASLMFKHEIFHQLFDYVFTHRELPDKPLVVEIMLRLNVCNDGATVWRRASTVLGWLRWIMRLPEE